MNTIQFYICYTSFKILWMISISYFGRENTFKSSILKKRFNFLIRSLKQLFPILEMTNFHMI